MVSTDVVSINTVSTNSVSTPVQCYRQLKKPPSKVAQKNSNPLLFLTAWAAQTAQTEEFMFQNVAYRKTVYRTGVSTDMLSLILK